MKKIFTSVDIGSDTVKMLVSEIVDDNVHVLSATTIKSKGIRKGLIVDSNLAINTIKDGIKIVVACRPEGRDETLYIEDVINSFK